jgi:mannosyltransferase
MINTPEAQILARNRAVDEQPDHLVEPDAARFGRTDATMILPRQRAPVDDDAPPEPDRWAGPRPAVGSASVESGGLSVRERALGTLAWVLPALMMAAVGFVRGSWPSLSTDELATWGIARLPWDQARRLVTEVDALQVPYYALMWGWAHLVGTAEFSLRLPSLLVTVIAVALTAALGTRLVGPRTGVLAGLALIVLPTTSRLAQDATPRAFALLGAVWSTYALVVIFDRPGFWRYLRYGLAVALLGLAGTIGLVVLVAHLVAVLVMRPRVVAGWLIAALLGVAPVAALLFYGSPDWSGPRWRLPAAGAAADDIVTGIFGALLVGGLVIGLGVLSLSARRPGVVFSTAALLPVVALYALSRVASFDAPATAAVTLFAWAGLAGMSLAREPAAHGLFVLVLAGAAGLPAQHDMRTSDGHGEATWRLGAALTVNAQTGDAVVYGAGDAEALAGRDIVARYVHPARRPADLLAIGAPRADGRLHPAECADVAKCMGAAPRVWLIRMGAPDSPLDGFPAAKDGHLRTNYTIERTWRFDGLTMSLLIYKPAGPDRPAPK